MSYIVENGRLMQLAVTAVQAFNEAEDGCQQRWHYKNVLGRKEPQRTWHAEGDDVQAQLDHFLATGEDVLGKVAGAGRHLLTRPGADFLIDLGLNNQKRPKPGPDGRKVNFFPREQSLLLAAGVPFIGFLDLINPRGETVDGEGNTVHDGFGEVVDHKTTSAFKWNYEQDEVTKIWRKKGGMLSSTQMAGYGVFVLEQTGDDYVRLSHNAYRTDPNSAPAALKATEVVSASAVKAHWHDVVEPIVEKMKSVAGTKREQDVVGNLNACGNFGGCPHTGYCHTYKQQNSLKRVAMGLLGNRKAAAPAAAANGAVAVAVPAPNGSTPWIPTPGAALQAPPQAYAPPAAQAAPPAQFMPPAVQAPAPQPERALPIHDTIPASQAVQLQRYLVRGVPSMYLCSTGGKQSFLALAPNGEMAVGVPPILLDYTESITGYPVGTAAATAPSPAPMPAAQVAPQAVIAPPPVQMAPPPSMAPPAPAQAAPAVPAATAPARRGRPTKAEAAAKAAGAPAAAVAQSAPAGAQAAGIQLFVNAVPNGPFIDLSGYIYEAVSELQEQFGVADIRVAPDNVGTLAFSKWKGTLAGMVRAEPPTAGTYVAFTKGSEFAEVVVEALAPLCAPGQLVRGV